MAREQLTDTWHQTLPMTMQAELNEAADVHASSLRRGENIDFIVNETWYDDDPKSGTVCYAMRHPHGNGGFRSYEEAEEACKALLADPVRQASTRLDVAIAIRTSYTAADGNKRGVRYSSKPVRKHEMPMPTRFAQLMNKLRTAVKKADSA